MCVCVCADAYYNNVRAELDSMAQDFEVESWSLAVDQHFLKKHSKEVIKRQDVIYGVCVCFVHTVPYLTYTPHLPQICYPFPSGCDVMFAEPVVCNSEFVLRKC